MNSVDIVADKAIIKRVIELCQERGLEVSAPMLTDSISDALDAPFGIDEFRQVLEVVTVVTSTGMSVVAFLAAVKALLKTSETSTQQPATILAKDTKTQRVIAKLDEHTDVNALTI